MPLMTTAGVQYSRPIDCDEFDAKFNERTLVCNSLVLCGIGYIVEKHREEHTTDRYGLK